MARPKIYPDSTTVAVSGKRAKSRLQPNSERKAIVTRIIDNGGRMTLVELDKSFGYKIRDKVIALMNGGWLEEVK